MSEYFDAAAPDTGIAGPSTPWPTSVHDLSEAERLVVWAFRRWVSGSGETPILAREFDRQFRRRDARPAVAALNAALVALTRNARRTISYHQPCCPCLGADEVCILSVVAAQQARAPAAARAMAQWLVTAAGTDSFLAPLDELAECLTASGLDLPFRARQRGPAAPAVIH